eukprot:gene3387-3877_t
MSSPQCADCFTTSCLMWRKTKSDLIVCNTCHLKRVKAEGNVLSSLKQKERGKEFVRQSSRKSKPSSKAARIGNGKYWDKLGKGLNIRSRRAMMKRKPEKSVTVTGSVISSKSIHYQGLLFKEGDVVSITDVSGEKYYAQLRGFLQDIYLNKSAAITWLLPTVPNPSKFDPAIFLPGPDEDTPRPMECFEFVSRAPSNLFKMKTSYPPYSRTRADLSSLLIAADEISNDISTDNLEEVVTKSELAES